MAIKILPKPSNPTFTLFMLLHDEQILRVHDAIRADQYLNLAGAIMDRQASIMVEHATEIGRKEA